MLLLDTSHPLLLKQLPYSSNGDHFSVLRACMSPSLWNMQLPHETQPYSTSNHNNDNGNNAFHPSTRLPFPVSSSLLFAVATHLVHRPHSTSPPRASCG